jgi:NH3-dependent NAD+ synthetase
MGQKPVKADWRRLAPTKAVNRCHQGLERYPRARLKSTKVPAMARMLLSMVMATSFKRVVVGTAHA